VSEVDKYRHLLERHPRLFIGNGIDIGSGGDPVVPWAIQIDLPEVLFQIYNQRSPGYSIQFRSVTAATDLPFKDSVLDFVFSSHLLEDFLDWKPVLAEWIRVLKPDGYLIIIIPDRERFLYATQHLGQLPNDAHRHEGHVGELTEATAAMGILPRIDAFTDVSPHDYSILFIGQKQ